MAKKYFLHLIAAIIEVEKKAGGEMKYNPHIHKRHSIRLKGYDYSQKGLYFITLCSQKHQHLFGHIEKGTMILNDYGEIIKEEWEKTPQIRKNTALHEYIIMPNHFHAIIEILFSKNSEKNKEGKKRKEDEPPFAKAAFKSPSQTIGAIIRGFKGATTKRIKELLRQSNQHHTRTGELQFAPTNSSPKPLAPKPLSPRPFTQSDIELQSDELRSCELQFAPTINAPTNIDLSKSIWHRNYYEHIIRDEKSYRNISNYIINNPANWGKDKFHKQRI